MSIFDTLEGQQQTPESLSHNISCAKVAITKLNLGEQLELKNQLGLQGSLQLVQIKSATSQVVAGQ